jgi:SPOR domain
MTIVNALFRHFGVRLWVTAFLGGFVGMFCLPAWQRLAGLHWSILPITGVMAFSFVVLGWAMNRIGTILLERQLKEAAVWERAGMAPEAEAVFEKVAALFDSFWLSPRKRNIDDTWVSGRVVRFYLSRPVLTEQCRRIVTAYLHRHPDDETVAESWLVHLQTCRAHTAEEYETADRVGDRLSDHDGIQWRLFQLYLFDARVDFDALRTYRRVWQRRQPLGEKNLALLARLLLDDARLDDWSLQVYLAAYRQGQNDCLEAIAAAVRHLTPHADNRTDLELARIITDGLEGDRTRALSRRFDSQVPAAPSAGGIPSTPKDTWGALLRRRIFGLLEALTRVALRATNFLVHACRGAVTTWLRSPRFRKAAVRGGICFVIVASGVAVWRLRPAPFQNPQPPAAPTAENPLTPATTDPYTIQVAAYLKHDDAALYADRLKQAGLDAFWTEAASANRTWYQVKVSHFATRTQAQNYGDQLKTRGIIDDFYVANYSPKK